MGEGQHSEGPHEEKPSKREGSGALRRVGRPAGVTCGVRCGRVAVSVIDPAVSQTGENRKASRSDCFLRFIGGGNSRRKIKKR